MESGIDPGQDYYTQDYYSYEHGFVSRLSQSLNITAAAAVEQKETGGSRRLSSLTSSGPCRLTPTQTDKKHVFSSLQRTERCVRCIVCM